MLPPVSLTAAALSLLAVSPQLAYAYGHGSHKPPTATVEGGKLVGTTTSLLAATATVNQFLGVPFATAERFSMPSKVKKWKKKLDASKRRPSCMQQFNYPESTRNFTMGMYNNPPPEESEDCLTLNIFAPSTPAPPGGYPVLFWIYGGSLTFGYSGNAGYDGSAFASYEDTIVVATNYRTNVFGFPNSPELPVKEQNLGLHDQHAALTWVQRNIKSFNGNPKKVTIFGESAGAFSVDALVTSSPSRPPFRAAIMQSGVTTLGTFMAGDAKGPETWAKLVAAVGCSGAKSPLKCVRKVPALKIKDVIERANLGFNPVRDGVTLVSDPSGARRARKIADVPVMIGSTSQEAKVFTIGQNDLDAYLASTFHVPALAAAIKRAYAIGSPGIENDNDAISAIYTDLVFTCPASATSSLSSTAGYQTHRFYFNASFANLQPPGLDLGVFHSSEISLVFSTYPKTGAAAAQEALSNYMRGAWG
ncbi:hypothetical protein V493_07969, partial [Pseudogymnoascus sp. VKM F-4281 (FW-2241)]